MDIGIAQITTEIASSTTGYLATYSSLFLLMGALVLALGIIGALIDKFFPDRQNKVTEV